MKKGKIVRVLHDDDHTYCELIREVRQDDGSGAVCEVKFEDESETRYRRVECLHHHEEREDYLNACRFAGCNFTTGEHFNCGSQHRLWCADCGALLYDSADDE